MARPTTSMKKGWLTRTSYDEIIHTWWWPKEIQIQLWWLQEIQIAWWSRSSSDDPDREMIQIWRMKMTWRLRRLKMQMTRRSSWYKEEDHCWKLRRKNTFLFKRECWCICNFGMYSSMYLMYCNPIFILGCIYDIIESCHTPMFLSGGYIM